MSETELLRELLFYQVERTVNALEGLTPAQLDWIPDVGGANSVLVIAAHTVGATERHVLVNIAGEAQSLPRETEFATRGDAEAVRDRWRALRPRVSAIIDGLAPRLDDELAKPGRLIRTVRGMLLHAVAHAAEHAGQAELTRDLARTRLGG